MFSFQYSKLFFALLTLGCTTFFTSCSEATKVEAIDELTINFEDAVTQQIIALRSKRNDQGQANIEALRTYLAVQNPQHRYAATLVAASVQDTNLIPDLGKMLRDPQIPIRIMAAFALGQTGHVKAAEVLSTAFAQDTIREVQAAILEAVGRCGNEEHLKYLAAVRPYPLKDTALLEGLALGIYRFAVRRIVYPEGTEKVMNDFVSNARMAPSVRFISANYLARLSNVDVTSYEDVLLNAVRTEKDPNTLMYWVIGLAKTQTPQAYEQLLLTYAQTTDYRVKANIIRALQYFKYESNKEFMQAALEDSVYTQIPLVAAEYFYKAGKESDALQYWNWAQEKEDWQVKVMLQAAALKNIAVYKVPSKNFMSQKMMEDYRKSENIYEKAALIKALSGYIGNYKILEKELFPTTEGTKVHPIIQSACAEALAEIRTSPDFDKAAAYSRQRIIDELNSLFRQCIEKGDAGVRAVIGSLFLNTDLNFKEVYPDYQFIVDARKQLRLPNDVETWTILGNVIDLFEGKTLFTFYKPDNYVNTQLLQPDWQIIQSINEKTRAIIATTKGDIVIAFNELTPATVSHFIQLAKTGYYNNKAFHRVVTNFVVQGGCERGDGWGGSPLLIPSELTMDKYWQEGAVGMASAGKDTEGTQFFITHAPAVQLDANYTLFARVVEGMSVVHQLKIGDLIKEVRIETN